MKKQDKQSKKPRITFQRRVRGGDSVGSGFETITLPEYASDSARIYAEELARACKRRKEPINPRDALVNTDDYPALLKCEQVEFMIGWLHGCAESHDVKVETIWDAIFPPAPKLAREVDKLKTAWGLTTTKRKAA